MSLKMHVGNLPEPKQFELALRFIKLAIPIWEKYSGENELSYRDTVVGLFHQVDRKLLMNSVHAIENYIQLSKLGKFINGKKDLMKLRIQFDDPVVSLQDGDWELPYEISKVFYAVYNLMDVTINTGKEIRGSLIYISINQAIDALVSSESYNYDQINLILREIGASDHH